MSKDIQSPKNILILNANPDETQALKVLCQEVGTVYSAPNLEKAIALISAISVNVLVVDASLGGYSILRGLLRPYASIIITGALKMGLKQITSSWPPERYVDIFLIAEFKADPPSFVRAVETAMQHSRLIFEVQKLRFSLEEHEAEIKEAYRQIKDIKAFVEKSVVSELEKRIAVEAKYDGFRRDIEKIESILKNLYMANDVTYLLDIVFDIKDLVQASSISMYILDKSETTDRYLKPLVWDDNILSLEEVTKHIVLLDFQDFAATTAMRGEEINTADLSHDSRLSSRYLQHLSTPLKSILCAPIKHDTEVIGVLEVYNKNSKEIPDEEGFTTDDENIIRQICEHISIAITKLNLIQYDALTGLLRPEPFFEKMRQKMMSRTKRHREESSFSLVMGDVDWFKHYNDRNGHEEGNKLLRELAVILKSSTREGDLLCRYGGEEFLFLLSCKDCEQESLLFTNRIRKNIENHTFPYQEYQPRGNLTMSFGITNFSRKRFSHLKQIDKKDLVEVVNEAETALAEAKGKQRTMGTTQEEIKKTPEKNKIHVFQHRFEELPQPTDEFASQEGRDPADKRRYRRFRTSTYIILKNGRERKVMPTLNLSLGGARISSDTAFERGESLDLSVILGESVLECKGDVVYSHQSEDEENLFHSGLKFRDLSFNDWKVMETYFASLSAADSPSL